MAKRIRCRVHIEKKFPKQYLEQFLKGLLMQFYLGEFPKQLLSALLEKTS